MESYALLIAATLSAGTVLALAALGLLINEKAGVVNLGAEGVMLCAAIAGFATVVHTGNTWLGFAAGMAAGALLAGIFGLLVIWLGTNQYATGLALSLFGVGFSAFVGINYVQAKLPELPKYAIPLLGEYRSWARRCFASTRWSMARCCWPVDWCGFCTAPAPVWCCARWASRPSRRTRWATRCGAFAWPR